MKKSFLITLIVGTALLISIPQVFALELRVSQDGRVYFYEDSILGDDENDEREESEYVEVEKIERKPIRTSNFNNGNVHVETNEKQLRVDLMDKSQDSMDRKTGFEQVKSSKVDRLKMEIPAGQSESQQNLIESRKNSLEDARESAKTEKEKIKETYKNYLEKLREERKERTQEKVELRNQQREDGQQEMEFESRGVTARLQNAEFDYDLETNAITLTTPSGEEHELNHLPDQAIERMMAIHDGDLEGSEVEITTTEDGSVEYKALGSKRTKLFGLISRSVDTEVTLDDETGEVVETQLPATTFLGRLLDRLSI